MNSARKMLLVLLPVLLSGCQVYTTIAPAQDYYYLNPEKDLASLGRVAIVELDNDSSFPAIRADVTECFSRLCKRNRFSVWPLSTKATPHGAACSWT